MTTSGLLEYLSIIIDLEKDKYTQEYTLRQLNNNVSSYTNEFNNNKAINERVAAQKIDYKNVQVSQKGKGIMFFMIYYCAFLGASTGLLANLITGSMRTAVLVGAIGAVAAGCIPVLVWKNIIRKRRQQAIIQLERQKRSDDELAISRRKRNEELMIIVPRLKSEIANFQDTYKLACKTLQKCYDVDIIPAKYRSMIPVCMFYDYILNKRTYSLERNPQTGDVGAINMYEDECYRQVIINKFDQLFDKLNEITQNQRELYNLVKKGNNETHRLLNEINGNIMKGNDVLESIEYQNEKQNRYMEYMAYVEYQRYMK